MNVKRRPAAGVSYATGPEDSEFRAHSNLEAVKSLAKDFGITEDRAAACLADPAEFAIEYRAHMTPQRARRQLERRYAVPL